MKQGQSREVRLSEGKNYVVLQRVDNGCVEPAWLESDTVMDVKP
jgi:hypothetical protein